MSALDLENRKRLLGGQISVPNTEDTVDEMAATLSEAT